jgi:hypothetical protein
MRYVKNKETGEIHDRHSADERCNVDDIKDKMEAEDLSEILEPDTPPKFCGWCFGPKKR